MTFPKNRLKLWLAALLVLFAVYAVGSYIADRSSDTGQSSITLRKRIADAQLPSRADPSIRHDAAVVAAPGATAKGMSLADVTAPRLHALL